MIEGWVGLIQPFYTLDQLTIYNFINEIGKGLNFSAHNFVK